MLIAKLIKPNDRNYFGRDLRLIGADGEQVGITKFEDAVKLAVAATLDLVLVAEKSEPPVCRIMDFGKYKFQQKKKTHDARKKQKVFHVKEIKLRPTIKKHDYEFKTRHIERFLKAGDKAKVTVMFTGRERQYTHIGFELLERVAAEMKDIATVEQPPLLEGRDMVMVLSPKSERELKGG